MNRARRWHKVAAGIFAIDAEFKAVAGDLWVVVIEHAIGLLAFDVSAKEIAQSADGVVVGSALVDALKRSLDAQDRATADTVKAVTTLVADIASGVRAAKGSSK